MKKILVIDDDEYIRNTFFKVLKKRGFEVETAESGSQALEKLKQNYFDIALIDVILPDMLGTELLTKAKKELEKTAKIMLTGFPSVETNQKASCEGADTYIIKPIKIEELFSVVNFFLKEKNESLG